MAVQRSHGVPYYYCCRDSWQPSVCRKHAILARTIDEAVRGHLTRTLTDPDIIARELARHREEGDHLQADLVALDRALSAVEKKRSGLARLVATLADDDLAVTPLVAELRSLAAQKGQLEAEREGARTREDRRVAVESQLADLAEWCAQVNKNLSSLTYEQRRLALFALDLKVRVWRKGNDPRFDITARIPLDQPGDCRKFWSPKLPPSTPSLGAPSQRSSTVA